MFAAVTQRLPARAFRVAILTVSADKTADTDTAGDILSECVPTSGHEVVSRALVKPTTDAIGNAIAAALSQAQILVTLGGTALGASEGVLNIVGPRFDPTIDTFPLAYQMAVSDPTEPLRLMERVAAGVVDGKLVFCLPSDSFSARRTWDRVLAPQLNAGVGQGSVVDLLKDPSA